MMGLGAYLVAAVVAVAGDDNVAELVERLGTPRFAEREAATKALRDLGPRALPALRAARKSKDPEIRNRAARLVDVLQADWLTTPTRLPLDFRDVTAEDIVKAIDGRNDLRISMLDQATRPPPGGPPGLTLRSNGPVTFWEAVDRFCEAAGQEPLPANHFVGSAGEPMTYLMPRGRDAGDSLHVNSGVFRVALESLVLSGERQPPGPGRPGGRSQLSAKLVFEAEPRMFAVYDGPCTWVEVVDDEGHPLVRPGGQEPRRYGEVGGHGQYAMGSGVFGTGQRFDVAEPLPGPDRPGRTLKKLRGIMPVLLAMREPDPLVVPLNPKGGGAEARDDRVAISVGKCQFGGPRGFPMAELDLTLRTIGPGTFHARILPYQIDVLDADGTRFHLVGAQITTGRAIDARGPHGPAEARVTLNMMSKARPKPPQDGGRPSFEGKEPVRLRFYHVFQATTEVAFSFEDLPLP
jgi:hypothetical protein